MKMLITSGGCKVPIDSVRHIGNFSSGRYGIELAKEFYFSQTEETKHEICVFREKGSAWVDEFWVFPAHDWEKTISSLEYKDYFDYFKVKDLIKNWQPDIIVSAAAISDYITVKQIEGKIPSDQDELVIRLKKSEKVLTSFRELAPSAYIVGFKLLVSPTDVVKEEAIRKLSGYCDAVVYNDLTELRKGNSARTLYNFIGEYDAPTPKDLVDLIFKFSKNKL